MSKWRNYQLQEIAEITMGQSPKGEFTNENGVGTPLLNGPTEFQSRFPMPVKYTTDPKKIAMKGDILWCVRGSTVGRRNFADQKYAIGRGLASIRSKYGQSHTEFIGMLLDFKLKHILSGATGSTFPNISKEQLYKFEFQLPDLEQQMKLAEILITFDNKIEINRQINETLEEMAMAIYKHWFVDFGPFQDGEFIESELGMIPKGWEIHSIYDLADYINGKAFKTKDLHEQGSLPVIKIAELKSGISQNTKYYNGDYHIKHEINNGDVLFAWSASLGVYLWSKGKAMLNQHIFNVQPKNGTIGKSFIYFMLKRLIEKFVQIAASRATTMGHITKEHLVNEKITLPPYEIFEEIQEKLNEYYKLIVSNSKELEQLINTRNYLLPKFLSGEIDLSRTEEKVGNGM
ncbi:restriction endonuclease subunit S [Virgibacillus halodenitrificans]|uniref:restriction endonuclease subunit S n=1 Tax=Virgibacillus halodenitrificans TaxID=1482 RepID=UPI0024BFF61C|nr:restriction endonuclease subunit S [Virgibacillus halodenitrificans]WHX24919.1 restriction endonuclease subunit S [Virgibacillus halodenitrificans]